ncbi:prohibitin family protein [Aquibium sp. ELW1220]|uniref:prohibitin family protein n=1 Tax=Aquibium sp. ELW1220 TaxID=2976766 RepID=UPI0025B207BB|nr:prohibitin family protein [Aquibium sp. ELW1220]MDN2584309.1 prohibitin family protein [Aquibium sp. ELW1220]
MKAYSLRLFRKISLGLSFLVLVAAFLLVVLWNVIVHTVPVGHAGVLWHRIPLFGSGVSRVPLSEGLHLILPWDKIYIYDLRLQNRVGTYQVLSRDGLAFEVELGFRWRVAGPNLVSLNNEIGPDYIEKLLVPEIGSVLRQVIAQFTAEALFTNARSLVQKRIYDQVTERSLPNGIGPRLEVPGSTSDVVILSDVLIKRVTLPERIARAIEAKLEQAQIVQEFNFRVEREALESERKRVEAEGIRSFQEIVTPGITESYLRWRGIEATLKLAQSPNSKIVVIGNSATGLPLILDTRSDGRDAVEIATPADEGATTSFDDNMPLDQGSLDDAQRLIDAGPGYTGSDDAVSPVLDPKSEVRFPARIGSE